MALRQWALPSATPCSSPRRALRSSVARRKTTFGTEGVRVELTEEFKQKLESRTGLPVIFWDERLTTVAADRAMMEAGIRRENRKEYVDKIAATFILQGYLDLLSNQAKG